MPASPSPTPSPPPAAVHSSGGGRPSRFLAAALAKLDLSVGAPSASPSVAPIASSSAAGLSFPRSGQTKARVTLAEPNVRLRKFDLLEDEGLLLDADSPSARRVLGSGGHDSDSDGSGSGELDELSSAFLADEEAEAARTADQAMATQLARRNRTFLTSLDLDTQMQMMRAHYRSQTRAKAGEARRDLREHEDSLGSLTAQTTRSSTSHSNHQPGDGNGSQSARRPARSHHASLSHLYGSDSSGALTSWSPSIAPGGGITPGTGKLLQVFNAAGSRFPPEEKHELGLHNPVSSFTMPVGTSQLGLMSSSKMLHVLRTPRSSELETSLFVRALAGTVGIPLMSAESVDGYVACLPKRNQFLLNPSSLDPITPGPGAYMGLMRAEYERGKVKELGGVMKTVTATNGLLKTRLRREPAEEPQATTRVADATTSLTKSGRANTSAAYQAAVLGTGSLTNLSRRRLRKMAAPGLASPHEATTTFGIAERPVGAWAPANRARSFLGPGSHAGAIEGPVASGFAKYGAGISARSGQLLAERRKEREEMENLVDSTGAGDAADALEALGTNEGGGGSVAGAGGRSLVLAKLNFAPLPSALTEVRRDALVSVPKDLRNTPGPGAYHVKHVLPHVPSARIVPILAPAPLEQQPGAAAAAAQASRRRGRGRRRRGGRKDRRRGGRGGRDDGYEEDARVDLGYFSSRSSRSMGPVGTPTPGPGAYSDTTVVVSATALREHLPNLFAFNSSARREISPVKRGLNTNELAVLAGAHQDPQRPALRGAGSRSRSPERRLATVAEGGVPGDKPPGPSAEEIARAQARQAARDQEREEQEAVRAAERAQVHATLAAASQVRAGQLRLMASGENAVGGGSASLGEDAQTILDRAARQEPAAQAAAQAAFIAQREAAMDLAHHRHWLAAQRRLEIRSKVVLASEGRAAILASIESRATHIAARSLILASQQRWLALLVHSRFVYAMWKVNAARQSVLREMAAAVRIQNGWLEFKVRREVNARFKRLKERLQANVLKYVIQHRIRKKRQAAALLARFFRDHLLRAGEKVYRLVHNFKAKIVTLQRFWRKHYARHKAEIELNLKAWTRVLHQPDGHHGKRLTASTSALPPPTPSPPTSPTKRRGVSVSTSLVTKYGLEPVHPSKPSGAVVQPQQQVQPMNALKQLILEKLHERRCRLEAERRKQQAMQAAMQQREDDEATLANGGTISTTIITNNNSTPTSGPTSPTEDESYASERKRYALLFAAPPSTSSGGGGGGVILQRKSSTSHQRSLASTPLQDLLRKAHAAEVEGSRSRRPRLLAESPSSAAAAANSSSANNIYSNPNPHGHAPRAPEPPVEVVKPPRLPSPKGRKPLYTPRMTPSIVLPGLASSAAAAMAAAEAQASYEELSTPRSEALSTPRTSKKVATSSSDSSVMGVDAVPTSPSSSSVAIRPFSPTPSASTTVVAPSASSTTASANSWVGLVVSLPLRVRLLRAVLRESRRVHWSLLSAHQRTLDDFLTHKLSSSESSLERARLLLTGTSQRLMADRAAYVLRHPLPKWRALLDPQLMRVLIVQGYLDQAEVADDLAARRAQLIALMQAAPQLHDVPDLFHVEKDAASSGGNGAHGRIGSRSEIASRGGVGAAKRKGFSTASALNPSPVQLMRLQAAQAAAQAAAAAAQAQHGDEEHAHHAGAPHRHAHGLLSALKQNRITIPPPRVLGSVLARQHAVQAPPPSSGPPSPQRPHASSMLSVPRGGGGGPSLNRVSSMVTIVSPATDADSAATAAGEAREPTPQEINSLFRAHASVSAHEHFPRAAAAAVTLAKAHAEARQHAATEAAANGAANGAATGEANAPSVGIVPPPGRILRAAAAAPGPTPSPNPTRLRVPTAGLAAARGQHTRQATMEASALFSFSATARRPSLSSAAQQATNSPRHKPAAAPLMPLAHA